MVTAGVYLVTRSAALYMTVPAAQYIVALVGTVTALFAATIAVGQYNIKKVLAYSTISQLGFMVAGVGMGAFEAGMFHLVTHAFFKALLFLSAGSVILGMERGHHHLTHAHHDEKQNKGKKKKKRVMVTRLRKFSIPTTCATWADFARRCRSRFGLSDWHTGISRHLAVCRFLVEG